MVESIWGNVVVFPWRSEDKLFRPLVLQVTSKSFIGTLWGWALFLKKRVLKPKGGCLTR